MLFGALCVFEELVFNPTKIIQGTCLGSILLKKCFLVRYLIDPVTFLLLFLPVCNYHNRKGRFSALRGKKQNEASLSGSKAMIFYMKKHFLAKKIAHCYAHC
jgi:hypothetical protein